MRTPPVVAALFVCLLACGWTGAGAVTKVSCLGDSITEGLLPFDEENIGGYPRRLQPLLRQGGLKGARVQNFGVGGDDTFEMLPRLDEAVANADILVVLGGTNDISSIVAGSQLFQDTVRNLDVMVDFARDQGLRAILGTVIPRSPTSRGDRGNTATYELVQQIRQLAFRRRYEVVDFWNRFPNLSLSTYELYYYDGSDLIGHPNAAGFARMAEVAAEVILDGDRQSPVDGRFLAPGKVERVNANTDYEVELFDFDSGILLSSATVVLNGVPIDTVVTGNSRKANLFAKGDGRRRCKVVLSVRASDRAEPPNELDFHITTFSTPQRLIQGDVDGNCRVDGRDLAIFGPIFGKSRKDVGWDPEMDIIANGRIDGDDFARLAANFGRGTLPAGAE